MEALIVPDEALRLMIGRDIWSLRTGRVREGAPGGRGRLPWTYRAKKIANRNSPKPRPPSGMPFADS